ncbi:hypothetical protein I4U23_031431 [Adineta vaga]|nr:hypothetical protein I4U23_031431 [Adineta vaga]
MQNFESNQYVHLNKMTSQQNEMRIILIGKTGNGKSSTGNSLLHSRSTFHATQSGKSITKECKAGEYNYTNNRREPKKLTVVDTPGFFDTDLTMTNDMVEKKIASQIFEMTTPGVHAFLIVLRVDRFTPEEKNTVDFIRRIFGAGAAKYCIVIFTREDQLEDGQSLNDFINTSSELQRLVQDCGRRVFAINNKLNGQLLERKTNQLIDMIDIMIRNNNGKYYTNAEYERIERERKEKQQKEEAKEKQNEERIREDERKKGEERQRKLRNQRRDSDDECDINPLVNIIRSWGFRDTMSPMSSDTDMPHGGMPGAGFDNNMLFRGMNSGRGDAHGGRFTGEYVVSNGSTNGRPIFEGGRGGQYHITSNGNRSYIRK